MKRIKGKSLWALMMILASWTLVRLTLANSKQPSDVSTSPTISFAFRAAKPALIGRPSINTPLKVFQAGLKKRSMEPVFLKAVSGSPRHHRYPPPTNLGGETSVVIQQAVFEDLAGHIATRKPVHEGLPPTAMSVKNEGENPAVVAGQRPKFVGSFWFLARGGSQNRASLASGGQLGGSQLGFRTRLNVFGSQDTVNTAFSLRGTSPLGDAMQELALGISVSRPGKVPIELILEQRIRSGKDVKDRPAALFVVGTSDVPLAGKFKLDGYLQAGVVGLKQSEAFAGAQISARAPIHAEHNLLVELGAGAWADIQSGRTRFDVGPELVFKIRSQNLPLRLALQWRQRLAGKAAPNSGPALVLAGDF